MSWQAIGESKGSPTQAPSPRKGKLYATSPSGLWVVSVGEEGDVVEVERAGSRCGTYVGHKGFKIVELAWVDEELVLSASEGGLLHLWHAPSAMWRRTLVAMGQPWPEGWSNVQDVVQAFLAERAERWH